MNSLKARLISLKKRVCRVCCKKRRSVRRKTAAYRRRVTSSLKRVSTIRRLRMTIRRRRAQPSCNANSTSVEDVQSSHLQPIEEQAQETSLHQIETMVVDEISVQPTRELSSPTASISNVEPLSISAQPACTPLSLCTTAMVEATGLPTTELSSPISNIEPSPTVSAQPACTSLSVCTTAVVEATVQPTREHSSLADSIPNIEASSTVPSLTLQPPCTPLSVCTTPTPRSPLTIQPPCTPLSVCTTATPPRSPSLTSWDSWSSMSSSDDGEDKSIDFTHSENAPISNDNDDNDDDDEVKMTYGDNVASHSTVSIHPVPTNVSSGIVADFSQDESTSLSRTSSEEELTAIFGDTNDDRETPNVGVQSIDPPRLSSIPTTCDIKEIVPVQYSNVAWMPNDHLLTPPFTKEQERYIVETNHPYKEFVLQRWDKMLQTCLEQACPQSSVTMSRTSSEEELRSIFGLDDTDDDDDEISQQLEPQTPKCDPVSMTVPETQFNGLSFQPYGVGSYSSLTSHQSCYCSCTTFMQPQGDVASQPTQSTLKSSGHFNFAPAAVDEWLHSQAATAGQFTDFTSLPSLLSLSSAASTVVPEQKTTPSTRSKPPPLKLTSLSCEAVPPLSTSTEESVTTPPPPPGPSTAEAEQMWKEYTENRNTAPEYFLYPPFTPEQEEWIVKINHPFKEHVLQTWQDSIHSSVQNWLDDLVS